jgi:hypothetical protein
MNVRDTRGRNMFMRRRKAIRYIVIAGGEVRGPCGRARGLCGAFLYREGDGGLERVEVIRVKRTKVHVRVSFTGAAHTVSFTQDHSTNIWYESSLLSGAHTRTWYQCALSVFLFFYYFYSSIFI